jgi:hypothetical protein
MRSGDQQLLENIDKQENTTNAKAGRIAGVYKSKLQQATTPQERAIILQDMMVDPETNESVIRRVENFIKDEAAGITAADRRVKSLTVAGRAKYFTERIQGMSRNEAARYLQEQINRRVLTPSVEEMMGSMQSFRDFFSQ